MKSNICGDIDRCFLILLIEWFLLNVCISQEQQKSFHMDSICRNDYQFFWGDKKTEYMIVAHFIHLHSYSLIHKLDWAIHWTLYSERYAAQILLQNTNVSIPVAYMSCHMITEAVVVVYNYSYKSDIHIYYHVAEQSKYRRPDTFPIQRVFELTTQSPNSSDATRIIEYQLLRDRSL